MGQPMARAENEAYELAARRLLEIEGAALNQGPSEATLVLIDDVLRALVRVLDAHERNTVELMWLISWIEQVR